VLFSLLSWSVLLFHCLCFLDSIYHIRIDSFEFNYTLFCLLCILHNIGFVNLFLRILLFSSLHLHFLNSFLFFWQSCLFGEETHDWFEDEHWERIDIYILISLLRIFWEIFDEIGLFVWSLFFHNRLVLLQVDYSILFVFLFGILFYLLVITEKLFNFLLYFH
jgi:hypothetical protein